MSSKKDLINWDEVKKILNDIVTELKNVASILPDGVPKYVIEGVAALLKVIADSIPEDESNVRLP